MMIIFSITFVTREILVLDSHEWAYTYKFSLNRDPILPSDAYERVARHAHNLPLDDQSLRDAWRDRNLL